MSVNGRRLFRNVAVARVEYHRTGTRDLRYFRPIGVSGILG